MKVKLAAASSEVGFCGQTLFRENHGKAKPCSRLL